MSLQDSNLTDKLLMAAIAKCKSQIAEAEAKITLYTTCPNGVAEHPNVVQEILDAAEIGAAAQEKLGFLVSVNHRAAHLNK